MSWDLTAPVWQVAPTLLGAMICRGAVRVRLVEVEAYDGAGDPASHAYRGRTARNAVMFGPPGHLYVYLSYGLHHACNVACGPPGVASGVLLRAGEVVHGKAVAQARRGRAGPRDLARGPGRLAQALGIDGALNGTSLFGGGEVSLVPGTAPAQIESGPRVGVSAAADRPWRYWISGDPYVSAYKRSPRALPLSVEPGTTAAGSERMQRSE
jgi:DNA-3-methyladenine glycosylase